MKRTIIILLLVLFLTGCSRETQVWLPEEEVVELRGREVVRIPMSTETEPAASEPMEAPDQDEEPEPAPAGQAVAGKATITKKSTSTPKKTSGNKTATNKETISGTGTGKPASTEPLVTEPPETEPPTYDIGGYQMGNLEYEMLNRINEHRSEAGAEPLWMDTWLCAIASCRSFEASRVWSHTRPDGRPFVTVLDDYGYAAAEVQELMVYDTASGDGTAMTDRWMESESQRESLLADYTTAGIGVYRMDGTTYVTCLLAK